MGQLLDIVIPWILHLPLVLDVFETRFNSLHIDGSPASFMTTSFFIWLKEFKGHSNGRRIEGVLHRNPSSLPLHYFCCPWCTRESTNDLWMSFRSWHHPWSLFVLWQVEDFPCLRLRPWWLMSLLLFCLPFLQFLTSVRNTRSCVLFSTTTTPLLNFYVTLLTVIDSNFTCMGS